MAELLQGRSSPRVISDAVAGTMDSVLYVLSIILVVVTFPICLFFVIKVVTEYERVIMFRVGRVDQGKPKGPGLIFYLPCIDEIYLVDLRTITFDIFPQEILTKDAVTIRVDAVVYYHLSDPLKAICNVKNYLDATQLLAQTTLRNVFGIKVLSEILTDREAVTKEMEKILDEATDPWGITVERIEIKDVRLPVMMQRAMAAEAEAVREAKAKIVAADGEKQASQALKEAADVISSSPAALQAVGHDGWTLRTPADLLAARKECIEEVKLPAEHVENIKKFNYPNEEVIHNYVKCSSIKLGFFDDENGYHVDHLVDQFGHGKDKVAVKALVDKCMDKNEAKTSSAEWAWRDYKCMIDAGLMTQVKKEVQS